MAATDYLFALSMEKLGYPDISPLFGEDFLKTIHSTAENVAKNTLRSADDTGRYSSSTHFDNQRRQDADVVRESNSTILKSVKENPTTFDIATLAAEYQALKQRQDGHGRV